MSSWPPQRVKPSNVEMGPWPRYGALQVSSNKFIKMEVEEGDLVNRYFQSMGHPQKQEIPAPPKPWAEKQYHSPVRVDHCSDQKENRPPRVNRKKYEFQPIKEPPKVVNQ